MLRSYKTEIHPTDEQKQIIHQTIGTCRYLYNFYFSHNKELYEKGNRFVSGMDFEKWLNHEFLPNHPKSIWIKEVRTQRKHLKGFSSIKADSPN